LSESDPRTDYSNFPGGNIVGPHGEAGEFSGPPKDPKDYKVYREVCERIMRERCQDAMHAGIGVMCEHRGPDGEHVRKWEHKPGHFGAPLVYACPHIILCDPINPEHMYYVPFRRGDPCGYVVCHTCFDLLEKKKLHIQRDIMGKCGSCIFEVVGWIVEKWPDRFHDLRVAS
jgi:hypothetical protein